MKLSHFILMSAMIVFVSCNRNPKLTDLSPEKQAIIKRMAENMLLVDGGTFTMGCTAEQGNDCLNDEKPAHQVSVSRYYIGKYEVTQEEWNAVLDENPSHFQGAQRPVENVSWNDVQRFIERLNMLTGMQYRLPTEAEWEYAARGGKMSKGNVYSGSQTIDSVAWYSLNAVKQTHKVGGRQPNELGLYDMSGNVWEWCADWYGDTYYAGSESSNPPGPGKGATHVLRGGSWNDNPVNCRVSNRNYLLAEFRFNYLGFRLVSPRL
jgi:formylglycine-generating enzyme required for sulfatase activity